MKAKRKRRMSRRRRERTYIAVMVLLAIAVSIGLTRSVMRDDKEFEEYEQGEVSERYTATHKCGLNHATQ